MQEHGQPSGDNFEILEPEVIAKKPDESSLAQNAVPAKEEWMSRPAETESLLAKPYTPSHLDEEQDEDSVSPLLENGNFYRRGILIHKLLLFSFFISVQFWS